MKPDTAVGLWPKKIGKPCVSRGQRRIIRDSDQESVAHSVGQTAAQSWLKAFVTDTVPNMQVRSIKRLVHSLGTRLLGVDALHFLY